MKLPWTIGFILEWWPRMTFSSVLKLRDSELREAQIGDTLTLKMRRPIRGNVTLRSRGSDRLTFDEVVKDEVYKEVLRHAPECKTIIDLGANIGLASLYFLSHCATAQILAVEPHSDTFNLLSKNLASFPQARPVQAAVWGSEKLLSVGHPSDPTHFSAFAAHEDQNGAIKGIPISQILAMCDSNTVDLLKVDIEGAEVELLKGDTDWLNRIGCIAIEFHHDSRRESGFDIIMNKYAFRVFEGSHTVIAVK